MPCRFEAAMYMATVGRFGDDAIAAAFTASTFKSCSVYGQPVTHCQSTWASSELEIRFCYRIKADSSCCSLRPHTTPFLQEKSFILGVIYGILLWADMNAATPLGARGRSVMSLAPMVLAILMLGPTKTRHEANILKNDVKYKRCNVLPIFSGEP